MKVAFLSVALLMAFIGADAAVVPEGTTTESAEATTELLLHPRGCIYILGNCATECPVGTRSYSNGCGPIRSERTCRSPVSTTGEGIVCDYSRCECEDPAVKDESTGRCVKLEDCPKDVDYSKLGDRV